MMREIPTPPEEPTLENLKAYVVLLMSEISRLSGQIEGMQQSINWRFEQLEKKDGA